MKLRIEMQGERYDVLVAGTVILFTSHPRPQKGKTPVSVTYELPMELALRTAMQHRIDEIERSRTAPRRQVRGAPG